ncbi:MAG: hypothetical protein ACOYJF_10075 [Prevotella sp.]
MIKTFLLSVLIIAIAIALLSIKILVKKNGQFDSQHVKDNKALQQKNIHCVLDQDREARVSNHAC